MTAPGDFSSGDVLTAADMNDLPAGVLDVDVVTSNISVAVGFPGTAHLTVTATLDTNRRYRVAIANAIFINNTVATICITDMYVGALLGTNRKAVAVAEVYGSSEEASAPLEYIVNGGLSGSQTFTGSFRLSAGTGTVPASAQIPIFMYIEDIGAV